MCRSDHEKRPLHGARVGDHPLVRLAAGSDKEAPHREGHVSLLNVKYEGEEQAMALLRVEVDFRPSQEICLGVAKADKAAVFEILCAQGCFRYNLRSSLQIGRLCATVAGRLPLSEASKQWAREAFDKEVEILLSLGSAGLCGDVGAQILFMACLSCWSIIKRHSSAWKMEAMVKIERLVSICLVIGPSEILITTRLLDASIREATYIAKHEHSRTCTQAYMDDQKSLFAFDPWEFLHVYISIGYTFRVYIWWMFAQGRTVCQIPCRAHERYSML